MSFEQFKKDVEEACEVYKDKLITNAFAHNDCYCALVALVKYKQFERPSDEPIARFVGTIANKYNLIDDCIFSFIKGFDGLCHTSVSMKHREYYDLGTLLRTKYKPKYWAYA